MPDLGVRFVKAKIDTGARTSALHVDDLEHVRRRGVEWVTFRVFPKQRTLRGAVRAEARLHDERRVRSSTGHQETRPVIVTTIDLGGATWEIELTLASRDEMGFRMLLGRQAIQGNCIIDPAASYLTRKSPKKRKKKVAARRSSKRAS